MTAPANIPGESCCGFVQKYSTAWYISFIREGTSAHLLHVKFNSPLDITSLLKRALKV